MEQISLLLIAPLIVWAAISDFKRRIIPNSVCFLIAVLSVTSDITPCERVFGVIIPAIPLFLIYLKFGGIGGGDIKYTVALGLYFGINKLAMILLVATVLGVLWSLIKRQKSLPLAVFIGISYIILLDWGFLM